MNIISTYVENVGPHEKKLIVWESEEGVSVLTGANGKGKTTLVEATFAAFYKDCPSYPTNIYGVVRQGSNGKAVIEVVFALDKRYRVRRELNASRKTPTQDAWIFEEDNPKPLAGPKERDFGDYIENLIGNAELALATWFAAYRSKGDICELDPAKRSDLIGKFINTQHLGAIGSRAKSEKSRTNTKISVHSDRVTDFERLVKPVADEDVADRLAELEAKVETLNDEETEVVEDIARMSERVEEATAADKLKRDYEQRVEQRDRLNSELTTLARRSDQRAKDEELRTELAERVNRLARLRKAKEYRAERRRISEHVATAEAAIKASADQLEQRAQSARDRLLKHDADNPYRDISDDELAEIEALEADERRLRDVEADLRASATVNHELERVEKLVAEHDKSIKTMSSQVDSARLLDVDTILKSHKELVGQQQKLATQRQIAERDRALMLRQSNDAATQLALWKQKQEDAEKARAEIKTLTGKLEDLDVIEQAFSRSGIQALLVEQAIKPFEMMASEMMQAASDGRHDVRIETMKENKDGSIAEKVSIIVADESGERDIRQYSGGEQSILSKIIRLAFARWVAERSGKKFGTVFIDEAFDSLDPEHVERLVDMLKNVAPYFENIITVTPNPVFASLIPHRIDFDAA